MWSRVLRVAAMDAVQTDREHVSLLLRREAERSGALHAPLLLSTRWQRVRAPSALESTARDRQPLRVRRVLTEWCARSPRCQTLRLRLQRLEHDL
jgi:hypothetical protein